MKAYRGVDDKIRMFRPDLNMKRMNNSASRSGLPNFDPGEMIKLLARLLQIDQEWVPHSATASLYIRPTLIGIDVSANTCRQCNSSDPRERKCPPKKKGFSVSPTMAFYFLTASAGSDSVGVCAAFRDMFPCK